MATDGCEATFPESELVKCLPRKTLGALHKIKQEKEVDEAEIEGLVKCPCVRFLPCGLSCLWNDAELRFST